jgi:hypothetical protein
MAIQPIDLQTLFTQMDKVGKEQSAQKEGLAIQQTLAGIENQKKTEEHIQSVNEAQNTGEGAEKVNDRNQRKKKDEEKSKDREDGDEDTKEPERPVIQDPVLGKNIDISG